MMLSSSFDSKKFLVSSVMVSVAQYPFKSVHLSSNCVVSVIPFAVDF